MSRVLEVITAEDCGACNAFKSVFPSVIESIKDRCKIKHYVTKIREFDARKMPDSVAAKHLFSFPMLAVVQNGQVVSIFNGKKEGEKWMQVSRAVRYDLPTVQAWLQPLIPAVKGIIPPSIPPRSPAQVPGVYTTPVVACQRAQYLPYNSIR